MKSNDWRCSEFEEKNSKFKFNLGDLSTALNGLFISVGSTCGRSLSFLAIVYGQHCREIQTEPSEWTKAWTVKSRTGIVDWAGQINIQVDFSGSYQVQILFRVSRKNGPWGRDSYRIRIHDIA